MRLTRLLRPTTVVRAHCDIPCGIYDPAEALLAAKTVARMVELINGLEGNDTATRNKFSRCVTVKEQHAEKVKKEVQVIWSDYFKPEHLEAIPDLHTKVWNLLKLAGKNKQNVDADGGRRPRRRDAGVQRPLLVDEEVATTTPDASPPLGRGAARFRCAPDRREDDRRDDHGAPRRRRRGPSLLRLFLGLAASWAGSSTPRSRCAGRGAGRGGPRWPRGAWRPPCSPATGCCSTRPVGAGRGPARSW